MTALVVTTAFPPYAVGASITDPTAVAAILASENARNVVQSNVGSTPSLSAPSVSGLIAGGTSVVAGTYYNGAPSGLSYSLDGGSLVAAPSPSISGGIYSFAITTPTAGTHSIVVTGTGSNTATSSATSFTTATASIPGGATYTGAAPVGVTGSVISLLQSGATTGQVLQWNGSTWAPTTITTSGGVTITGTAPIAVSGGTVSLQQGGATTGQALVWNGTTWAPGTVSGGSSAVSSVSIDGSTIVASTGAPYQMLTADRVVDVNKTTGAATKILLPSNPALWVEYTVIDGKGDAGANNITVTLASGTINGATTFVMNANNTALTLRAVNATTWRIT